ncbi:uncharacterized protein LOC108911025 isoform X2 [Anoplophora glabripennis]|uniref:uncharacterized protein LOC108911025 isoform X2 n=1 Tax=Anoplophora glabripennis TaxID=217634 RepID=UPI0008740171|nr:uncharacterized protein LOC108911025 isoform X2 [Anoplophora glabripennis]
MSATTATVTVETSTASWRKRSREDDSTTQMDLKRPRCYYFRLESESSKASEEDTESVYSLQDRETDVVRDTSDTDSKSGCSDAEEYEVHYEEYDVASLSGSENGFSQSNSSSDSEASMMLAAAAAVICDTSLENWITDCEDSDNSSLEELSFKEVDFSTCIQCKSDNNNPLYRYCEKCFQTCRQCKMRKTFKCFPLCVYCYKDRKKFYPPRPKRNKKSRKDKQKEPPVKLDVLRTCLNNLSQDSGIGSSQEWQVFGMAQIVLPDSLPSGTSQISTITELSENAEDDIEKKSSEDVTSSSLEQIGGNNNESQTRVQETKVSESSSSFSSTNTNRNVGKGRKRYLSESSLSDFDVKPHASKVCKIALPENDQPLSQSQTSDLGSEIGSTSFISSITEKSNTTDGEGLKGNGSENTELCIFCNDAPKDAIFLHSKVAHQCCCYRCAKRTIKTRKRCPICNVAVSKVFRVIKS